jgi:ectoine hydroxylase-related dioxygenase (phytanoyl-CoA dioxygenase family)
MDHPRHRSPGGRESGTETLLGSVPLGANLHCRRDSDWCTQVRVAVDTVGYAVVEGVLGPEELKRTRDAMFVVRDDLLADIGQDRLDRAGELGVLRLMMRYDPSFVHLAVLPEVLAVVDAMLSDTAILHLQNGLILPPVDPHRATGTFQLSFHRDFPRYLNGFRASLNTMLAIDEYTAANGGTLVVPGTQQLAERPDPDYLERAAIPVECPAGSMVVFDSTLWHAAGENRSDDDRVAINQQFTCSWIKQQIDYVRALGDDVIAGLPARAQQVLGWYTRVVTSLDQYYQPPERRLYRSGQG